MNIPLCVQQKQEEKQGNKEISKFSIVEEERETSNVTSFLEQEMDCKTGGWRILSRFQGTGKRTTNDVTSKREPTSDATSI